MDGLFLTDNSNITVQNLLYQLLEILEEGDIEPEMIKVSLKEDCPEVTVSFDEDRDYYVVLSREDVMSGGYQTFKAFVNVINDLARRGVFTVPVMMVK